MASLGRPNKTEVADNFLERNIPVVIIEDDKFSRIVPHKFQLLSRAESVIAAVDIDEKVKYEIKKQRQEAKEYISQTDDPIKNIFNWLADKPRTHNLLNAIINKQLNDTEIQNRIKNLERKAEN